MVDRAIGMSSDNGAPSGTCSILTFIPDILTVKQASFVYMSCMHRVHVYMLKVHMCAHVCVCTCICVCMHICALALVPPREGQRLVDVRWGSLSERWGLSLSLKFIAPMNMSVQLSLAMLFLWNVVSFLRWRCFILF